MRSSTRTSSVNLTPKDRDALERREEILRYSIRFPASQKNIKDRVQVFVEETMDIPVAFIRRGGWAIRDEIDRIFAPSISELRTACARAIRQERWRALGIKDERSDSGTHAPMVIAQEVAWAQRHAPNGNAGDISALPPEVSQDKVGPKEALEYLDQTLTEIVP